MIWGIDSARKRNRSPLCRNRLRPPVLGHVLKRQEDEWRGALQRVHTTGVEEHHPVPDRGELVLDLVLLDRVVAGEDIFQKCPQRGNVPLSAPQVVEEPVQRLLGLDLERLIEGPIRRLHPQVVGEDEERLPHRIHDALGVLAGFLEAHLGALGLVDVSQNRHGAVDLVLGGPVGADAEHVPAAVSVAYLALLRLNGVDHLRDQRLQVGQIEDQLELADGASDVGRQKAQDLTGRRREPADAEIDAHGHHRHVRAAEQVGHVIADPGQFQIPVLELLVDRHQLFVDGLELFLGGLQLLVGAPELLVAGEDLFVGRFQLLVNGVLLLDDGLEVVAHRGEFLPQPVDFAFVRGRGHPGITGGRRAGEGAPQPPRQPAGRAVGSGRVGGRPRHGRRLVPGLLEQHEAAAFAGVG